MITLKKWKTSKTRWRNKFDELDSKVCLIVNRICWQLLGTVDNVFENKYISQAENVLIYVIIFTVSLITLIN